MITGISTRSNLIEAVTRAGFSNLEIRYDELKNAEELIQKLADDVSVNDTNNETQRSKICCINLTGDKIDSIRDVLHDAERLAIPYVLIETEGLQDVDSVIAKLMDHMEVILKSECRIVLENGYYIKIGDTRVRRNGLCDAADFKRALNKLRQAERAQSASNIEKRSESHFAAAFNVGHAMLFSSNVVDMITELGSDLMFLHANDNDGIHDMHQMPYTFTVGRGILLTDWRLVIRELHRIGFDGALFLDIDGLYGSIPTELIDTMSNMAYSIASEWDKSFHWDEILETYENKKLITFGAGPFMHTYMQKFGQRHKPFFIIDKNESRWGETFDGVEIKNPEEIRKIPADECHVLVCVAAYRDIVKEIHDMGIASVDYFDAEWFTEEDKENAETWCPDKGDIRTGTLKKWYRYDKGGRLRLRRFQPGRIYHELRNIWRKAKSFLRRIAGRT